MRANWVRIFVLATFAVSLNGQFLAVRAAEFNILPVNKVWKYMAETNSQTFCLQGTGWEQEDFDDSSWPSGPGGFTGGENTSGTSLAGLLNTTNLPAPTAGLGRPQYFRTHFNVPNPAGLLLVLSNRIDDQAVFYLNGTRVADYLHPNNPERCSPNGGGGEASAWVTLGLSPVQLAGIIHPGDNVLAVSVHQGTANSSDMVFACILTGITNLPPPISFTNGAGPITFDIAPLEWTTRSWTVGTATNATLLDALVHGSCDYYSINLPLPSAAGNPPSATTRAQYASDAGAQYVMTRPTGTTGDLLMATLTNNSGGSVSAVRLSYTLTVAAPVTEEVPGHLVYYSLTGISNTWVQIPELSSQPEDVATGAHTKSAVVSFGTSWPANTRLYFLWVDDNGPGTDTALMIDNVQWSSTLQTPVVLATNRAASTGLVTRVTPSSAQLKVFSGGAFTNSTNIHLDRMTIVLTHGWNSSPAYWPSNMAAQLASDGITANILAWDWEDGAGTGLNLDLALSRTCTQGEALGMALSDTLGTNYQREFHFIGHSLGTLVNRGAANYLHGDSKRKPAVTKNPARTHVTLLDDAELANVGGVLINTMLQNPAGSAGRVLNGCYLGFAIPDHYAWVDNYFSFAGTIHPEAVNVFLPRGLNEAAWELPNLGAFFETWHGYPYEWYTGSVGNSAGTMGHQWSFERNGVPGPYANDTLLLQANASGSPYALRQATSTERSLISVPLAAGYYGEHAAGFVVQNLAGAVSAVGQAAADVAVGLFQISQNALTVAVSDWTYRFSLQRRQSGQFIPAGGNFTNTLADSYVWVPVAIPSNAVGMSFQFRFLGVNDDDFLTVGISNKPLMMIESRFIAESNWVSSGVLDISALAGQTVEVFLGYSGSSTNEGDIEVDSLQFYTLSGPGLSIAQSGGSAVLSWPASAIGYHLESTATPASTNSWSAVTNVPVFDLNALVVTNQAADPARFFRLRRP